MILGTKFDKVKEYIEKYKNDGILWFLEIFEMSTPQLYLQLLKMKQNGYFKDCKGIIFGRSFILREDYEITFKEALQDALSDLKIPVIYDVDIGHVPPQMSIVNGSILEVSFNNGKGTIENMLI